ncbi:hypothetical protein Gotur_032457 [Gossypium turneri]
MFDIGSQINDMSRLIEGQARYFIDASKYGNVSRFINHSCSPNLVNHQVLVDSMDCHRAHIGLYASQDISVGEELTFDYRYELLPGQGYPCQCGGDCKLPNHYQLEFNRLPTEHATCCTEFSTEPDWFYGSSFEMG